MASAEGICKDWENGICPRPVGNCKWAHPDEKKRDRPAICTDFQKGTCNRRVCKFLHFTKEEEENYIKNRIVPEHKGRIDKVKEYWGPSGPPPFTMTEGPPIPADYPTPCQRFLLGKCRFDAHDCHFRHATKRELDLETQLEHRRRQREYADMMNGKSSVNHGRPSNELADRAHASNRYRDDPYADPYADLSTRAKSSEFASDLPPPPAPPSFGERDGGRRESQLVAGIKRRRTEGHTFDDSQTVDLLLEENAVIKRKMADLQAQVAELREMGEENLRITSKLKDCQRQITDLREINDTLYDQNNKYRAQLLQ